MPENQTTQPWAEKERPWGHKKTQTQKVELQERYRRIGIASVAAAADVRGNQCGSGGKSGGR